MSAPAGAQERAQGQMHWLALGAVIVCVILFSEGLLQRLVAGEMEADGNLILRVMWLPVYGVVACLALSRWQDMLALAVRVPFLMLLVALAAMSFLWSIDPGLSMRRGLAVGMTTVFGLYLAVRFSWLDLLRLLGAIWLGLALLSFCAGLISPGFARDQEIHIGAWRGFWFEKNTMGGHMSRVGFLFAMLALVDARRRLTWLFATGLAGLLVLLSTSATALLGLMLGLGIVGAGAIAQSGRLRAILLIWLGVAFVSAGAAFILLWPDVFFELIGKDPSLTGRTDIWVALVDSISARPWLGYGYGAFWNPDSEPAYWVRIAVEWDAPTAHNGWLDIALSVGLVGMGLFVLSFGMTLARAIASGLDHRFALYCLGFLAQLGLFSFSESILLEQNSLVWISFVALAALLAKGLDKQGRIVRPADLGLARLRLSRRGHGLI
ncbi:MAG: O-antigen ligase family protein [Hyphomonadaceae bacterium]|nr:O-antigen ligase family protein [Hyphomonadaceae bacterium]